MQRTNRKMAKSERPKSIEKNVQQTGRIRIPISINALLTMSEVHLKEVQRPIKMMERSIFSTKECCIELMKNRGAINKASYDILQE